MSPKPFTEDSPPKYEEDPLAPARGIFNALVCMLVIIACLAGAIWIWTGVVQARTNSVQPIAAPQSVLHARHACPNGSSLVKCRAALRHAYEAVAWQRNARWHAQAKTSRDVVLDAIHWASGETGVPAWRMIGIGTCESHLFWLAQNGQYKSWAQLSTRHRSDPIIARLTWRDPYAVALHVALYIKHHGEGEWQCTSSGGLRW